MPYRGIWEGGGEMEGGGGKKANYALFFLGGL